ncbi:conserved hypothetical protein [Vibrio chagasii]|uniref:DUF1566 domain-containing protein n=1 Tax=Vibrio TaxID=662 RepID=UPI00076A35EF|nr:MULTISPECIES: DUF1566 domain-containing protein [Vibrio]MDE9379920.1 DUF1566 domain-containing protein [Vibrio alginolyticus]MCG9560783.1 DUF1566 domain-containing protein [Vibrio chagasii]MCG9604821.1 DUF1566 domain-containing protein [Vibrio chagasii]NOI40649.1 DUF1566 domain-containing protein [Vibrio sp. 070316B]NOI86676.1 DUF1566 domain-containing protein [Vibrio sp. 99K-1]
MERKRSSWQFNAISVVLLATLFSGCKSGHENNDENTTDPGSTPSVVEISVPNSISFSEPSSGSSTQSITVSLSEALPEDLTLTISTSDVTTRSDGTFKNYDAISSQNVKISAGATSADLPLNLVNNNLYEGNKTLHYSISVDNNTNYTLSNERTVVTIDDSDTQPTVSFSNDLRTVVEGDSIVQQAVLSHYTSQDVTLTLTQNGIAAPEDFIVDISGLALKLPAETLSTNITFTARDDSFDEGGESVIYTIASVGNATINSNKNTLAFYIPGQKNFNDTGYVTYFDGTDYDSVTPPASHPNQDADFGLDVTNGDEHSDGEYGFRYTKLDAHGNRLTPSATDWRCVRDEHTGLYIEAKQAPIALPSQSEVDTWVKNHKDAPDANPYPWDSQSSSWRSASYTYTWYDSDNTTNGGYAGAPNDLLYSAGPISSQCAYINDGSGSNYCNTASYIDSLNSRSICGITDWRLPSPVEARSFINFNVGSVPAGAIDFFPNLGERLFTHSSSVKQDGSARCIDSQSGELELCNKNIAGSTGIVAVSGGIE